MARFSFLQLIGSQWVEQQKITAKGRRDARKKLEESNTIKGKDDPGGIWKLRKIEE